eukprot:3620777-Pleurochrysis_carterae.AAC.1
MPGHIDPTSYTLQTFNSWADEMKSKYGTAFCQSVDELEVTVRERVADCVRRGVCMSEGVCVRERARGRVREREGVRTRVGARTRPGDECDDSLRCRCEDSAEPHQALPLSKYRLHRVCAASEYAPCLAHRRVGNCPINTPCSARAPSLPVHPNPSRKMRATLTPVAARPVILGNAFPDATPSACPKCAPQPCLPLWLFGTCMQ